MKSKVQQNSILIKVQFLRNNKILRPMFKLMDQTRKKDYLKKKKN